MCAPTTLIATFAYEIEQFFNSKCADARDQVVRELRSYGTGLVADAGICDTTGRNAVVFVFFCLVKNQQSVMP